MQLTSLYLSPSLLLSNVAMFYIFNITDPYVATLSHMDLRNTKTTPLLHNTDQYQPSIEHWHHVLVSLKANYFPAFVHQVYQLYQILERSYFQ